MGGFRTVVIKSRAKLELRLNYLVIRSDAEQKIFLKEIAVLIIQSTAVSLTAALLAELCRRNIKVVFCDEKCNPVSELLPYYGVHNTTKRYKEQIAWCRDAKDVIWRSIVCEKIRMQACVLLENGFNEQANVLRAYIDEVEPGDVTNREGHAAKVYFNCILGEGNFRGGGGFLNACLNYGYTVLLSAFNREIVAHGYLTQLGIWHDNEFNEFNLACDLMEPFRPIVDRIALSLTEGDKDFKRKMTNVLNLRTQYDGKNTTMDVAIRQYVKDAIHAISAGDEQQLKFITDVELPDE